MMRHATHKNSSGLNVAANPEHLADDYSALEASKNGSTRIAVTDFPFSILDSPAQIVIEAVHKGWNVEQILGEIIAIENSRAVSQALSRIILSILEVKNPLAYISQIGFAVGAFAISGESIPVLAKRHGMSKQSFQQGVRRVCECFEIGPNRSMRSQEARENMRLSNWRNDHGKPNRAH
jgi:hypothetical protein